MIVGHVSAVCVPFGVACARVGEAVAAVLGVEGRRDLAAASPGRAPRAPRCRPPEVDLGRSGVCSQHCRRVAEHVTAGCVFRLLPRRSCAGTATWSSSAGSRGRGASRLAARVGIPRSPGLCCGWLATTRTGATGALPGSWPISALRCRCVSRLEILKELGSTRRHAGMGRLGRSSCAPRPRRLSRDCVTMDLLGRARPT